MTLGGLGLGLLATGTARADLPEPPLTHILAPVKPPRPAPDFSLPDTEGKIHKLTDYPGRVVLLNFWATWCPPCRRELPSMEKLYQALKGKPFQVLACDQQEDADTLFAFTGQLDPAPTFPVLLDSNSAVSKAYGVPGLPTTFLIDKTGQIAYRAVGGREFDHPAIHALIEKLMAA
ncbi:MAG: thioredoxin [Thiobacillus sp. SCN 63-57]|nr:MAG: thioredoxin [Thiobacillus sp. SCN 63-57]